MATIMGESNDVSSCLHLTANANSSSQKRSNSKSKRSRELKKRCECEEAVDQVECSRCQLCEFTESHKRVSHEVSWIVRQWMKNEPPVLRLCSYSLSSDQLRRCGLAYPMMALTELDLSYNNLTSVDCLDFSNYPMLDRLSLDHNNLTGLPPSIGALEELCYMSLQHNSIRKLPSEVGNLTSLRTVIVHHNQLETLPVFHGCLHVEKLIASHNRISELSPKTFRNCVCLKVLDLRENELTDLTGLSKLPAVSELRLSYNKLQSVATANWEPCSALAMLDLAWNDIESVEIGRAGKALARLVTLKLNGNPRLKSLSLPKLKMLKEVLCDPELELGDSTKDGFVDIRRIAA